MTIMTITTVSARDAAVDATASNNKADEAARHPPPMLPHTSQDFQFAERALQQIVLFSSFFPARAAQADWFPSHDPIEAKMRGGSFCDEHSSSAGSLATADTVSDTSSPLSYRIRCLPTCWQLGTDIGSHLAGYRGCSFSKWQLQLWRID